MSTERLFEIQNKDWFLEIDLNGGRIKELKYKDQIILGTYERSDGKMGNTHICAPNFAAEGVEKYGFIFHGPFRNSEWSLINQSENRLEIELDIEGLLVNQKFIINNNFKQEIKVKNISIESKRVNVAIHNYFDSEFGWEGIKINGMNANKVVEISDYIELKDINLIQLPDKKSISWKVNGFKFAKLWASVGDKHYICIEPGRGKEGFIETDESLLIADKELNFKQIIEVI